jgi:predicted cation transporter
MSDLASFVVSFLAVLAQAIVASALTPFVRWYVATRGTNTVVVVDAISGRFVDFVDRIKRSY